MKAEDAQMKKKKHGKKTNAKRKVPTPGITVMFHRGGPFRKEKKTFEEKRKCRGPLREEES
jgi:hypothetical protein